MSTWSRALELAERTPVSRNRYVDLLRAASILAVVFGHWLIAAPSIRDGTLRLDHMLRVQTWTQWLTLLFQVMPVFFLVGGYSNAASWDAAQRKDQPYGTWIVGRLRRLVGPVLPLLSVWLVIALVGRWSGISPVMIREGSKLALVPLWFLAVYVLVVALVPLTRVAWKRFGMWSYWTPAAAAVLVDIARFADGHRPGIGWVNYLFVWVAVHQLGYAWRDGRLAGPARTLRWAIGGAVLWGLLARFGPYPVSMVGVPGDEVSNTLPPDIMLLALGAAQTGLLLTIEAPARRWLARTGVWAATVMVNATIMSVYLWHLTVMALLVGLANLVGGVGLRLRPGSATWWVSRPLWLGVLALGLLSVLPVVGRFERSRAPDAALHLSTWRVVPGIILVCAALALLALDGIGGDDRLVEGAAAVAMALAGAWLAGASPVPGTRRA